MKTTTTITIVCALGFLMFAGCMRSDTLPREVTGAYEQAFNGDDLDAVADLFTKDAQILPQDGPVVSGREGIEQFLKNQRTPTVLFNTDTEMSLVRGDIGVEQGAYSVRDLRRGFDIEHGKYMHVWRRVGGDWKLYRIIYNTDVAPQTEVSVAAADAGV